MLAASLVQHACAAGTMELLQTPTPDLTVTDRIFFDVGIASSALKPAGERTLGDKTVLPKDAQPVGRIVIGVHLLLLQLHW